MNKKITQKPAESSERPPVIAIMGHIDHGKSTLLDYIRETNTVAKEAGGITQHIGAYEAYHITGENKEKKITFLDTPGHAAFTGIRERGAKVADIAVLIVSAEEGVKAQTTEALKVILKEEIPYIVAITKIDKPGADVERTKQNLAENEIYVEGYGGSIPCVPISAKTGEGVPELLDMMLLVAELEELKADAGAPASGIVIEANRDTQKGITGTIVIQNGTLELGQFIVSGTSFAPVRIMEDASGRKLKSATFSSPVRIIGWNEVPAVGLPFYAADSKKDAERAAADYRFLSQKKNEASAAPAQTDKPQLNLILKADVSGSLEAIENEIGKLPKEKVEVKIVQASIGSVSDSEVKVAAGIAGTTILAFGVKTEPNAESLRERLGVTVAHFDIIYKLVEWIEEKIAEMTPKEMVEESLGRAKVLKTFSRNKDKQVFGGKVETGNITIGCEIKILRRDVEIARGKIRGLQEQKSKVSTVAEGHEFGAEIESKMEAAPGDRIECFRIVVK